MDIDASDNNKIDSQKSLKENQNENKDKKNENNSDIINKEYDTVINTKLKVNNNNTNNNNNSNYNNYNGFEDCHWEPICARYFIKALANHGTVTQLGNYSPVTNLRRGGNDTANRLKEWTNFAVEQYDQYLCITEEQKSKEQNKV